MDGITAVGCTCVARRTNVTALPVSRRPRTRILDANAISDKVKDLTPDQTDSVPALRQILAECSPGLSEDVCNGKWYTGLLTYKPAATDFTICALGPLTKGVTTFHMLPYYMNPVLHERHGAALNRKG